MLLIHTRRFFFLNTFLQGMCGDDAGDGVPHKGHRGLQPARHFHLALLQHGAVLLLVSVGGVAARSCSSLRVMKARVDMPSTMPDLGGIAPLHMLMK